MLSRLELERMLGNVDVVVPNPTARRLLYMWLLACGMSRNIVNNMTFAQMINHYRDPPPYEPPTAIQTQAAEELFAKLTNETVNSDIRHHRKTAEVIKISQLGHPIMLVGPAGCGKTTIGENVASALGFPFYITSTVFDTHELLGFVDGFGKYKLTAFRQAFQGGGVWVADEIDAWDAAALLAANSALANGKATFPDSPSPVERHPDFRMIATANTFGKGADRLYIGRNELDAASLDRFAVIEVDYDKSLEMLLCGGNVKWLQRVRTVREAVQDHKIRHVVSTRAIIMGAAALAAGVRQDRVEEIYLFKGMSRNDREKLK